MSRGGWTCAVPWPCRPARLAMAAALLAGCGAHEKGGGAEVQAPARVASREVLVTRFAPGQAADSVAAPFRGFCQPARGAPGIEPVRFDTVAAPRAPRALMRQDRESSLGAPLRCVVRSQREWDAIRPLTSIYPDSMFPAPAPDFSREMLVVAALGKRPTYSYEVWIDGSWMRADTLVVAVRELTPAGDTDGDMGTAPAAVSRVPRARVVFFLER
jgi:hypothetical protein